MPWLLSGIRGDATVLDSISYNTMDPGWIFNEHAVAQNLRTVNGHDNGFSLSRGNQAVTASNLYARKYAAGYACWIGGFLVNNNSTDYGSTTFNITNITGINCGWGGVYLDEAPKDGVISGIYMKGMLRGTAARDFGDDSAGTGIRIGGSPSNDLPNQVSLAENLLITGFVLVDCAKGGVIVSGATDVTVGQGLIINPDSTTDYAGNTIASTSTTENFGIAAKANSTTKITRFTAQDVTVVDTRATPLANYAIWMTGTTDPVWRNVRGVNTRQLSRTTREEYREQQGTVNYIDQIRYVTGIRVGQTTGSTGRAELLNIAAEPAVVSGVRVFYVQAGALK